MKQNAFTLVETLVAISIITVAIAGPMAGASRALIAAYIARDQMTAAYLAQEGVEYVHLMRDTMYLADYATYPSDPTLADDVFCDFADPDPSSNCQSAITGTSIPIPAGMTGASIYSCLGAGDGSTVCELDDPLTVIGSRNGLSVCPGGVCSVLHTNGGRYTTSVAGSATPFTRSLTFYGCSTSGCTGANDLGSEIEVVSTVTWKEHAQTYSTSITDILSPWQ